MQERTESQEADSEDVSTYLFDSCYKLANSVTTNNTSKTYNNQSNIFLDQNQGGVLTLGVRVGRLLSRKWL